MSAMPGLPPAIMAALQSGGAPAGPGGPPPGPQDGSVGPKGDGDWEQDLMAAIAALRELEGDADDHQEAAVISQCITQLRKISAQRQSGAESALGITAAHKSMKRAAY